MALDDPDLPSGAGQHCCSREATQAAPNHDHIISFLARFLSNAHASNLLGRSRLAAGALPSQRVLVGAAQVDSRVRWRRWAEEQSRKVARVGV